MDRDNRVVVPEPGYRGVVTADDRVEADGRTGRSLVTGEPVPERDLPGSTRARFVVQRHDARRLHFDVRLEIDGVLVSWAVPRGPSLNPSDKRLAHRTEDHSLGYLDFEGRIDGGYGAGTVIVWDIGTYENLSAVDGVPQTMRMALEKGHIKVALRGEKLAGAFALIHTRAGGDDANWLLVKVDDEHADRRRRPASTQNRSVLTGRTNEDLERS